MSRDGTSCPRCGSSAIRDYKSEGVGANLFNLRTEREVDPSLVLPTAKDYQSKDDPDGSKGLNKWLGEHEGKGADFVRKQLPAGTRSTS